MACEYVSLMIAGAGGVGALLGAAATYWGVWKQMPKPDTRVDGIALVYRSIEVKNRFLATITNHGNAVADILRNEVNATVDGLTVEANIGELEAVGPLAAGASKELLLEVKLSEQLSMNVHDGKQLLRLTVTMHPRKGKESRSTFDFSRDPGYGFIPSAKG